VQAARDAGKHVMDRCNLTVLLLPRNARARGLARGAKASRSCASLPHWRRPNTDAQRGDGVYERSIRALRVLNAAGYGKGDPGGA
jgi:hypothetical protein